MKSKPVFRTIISLSINLVLILFAVLLVATGFDYVLSKGVFDEIGLPWAHTKATALNLQYNKKHLATAENHPYRFNTTDIFSPEKPAGISSRIAVLGDSFIWGDGLENPESIWSRRLKRRIEKEHPDIQVLEWGRCGWSTLDELHFLKSIDDKKLYDIDHLIIGFVTNDPDLGDRPQKYIKWDACPANLCTLLPNLYLWIQPYVERYFYMFSADYGYTNWEDALYTPENLAKYRGVLVELKQFLDARHIPFMFVFTPNTPIERFPRLYEPVIALFDDLGIPYLNLFPAVQSAFGHTPQSQWPQTLYANPVNGHPGEAVTAVYADHVYAHLLSLHWLK
jgi:hypothetical protein